jgi:hypothetical protein
MQIPPQPQLQPPRHHHHALLLLGTSQTRPHPLRSGSVISVSSSPRANGVMMH